jgi:hypothetical protein
MIRNQPSKRTIATDAVQGEIRARRGWQPVMARDGHQRMQLSRLDEAKKKPRRSKRTPGLLARSGGLGVSQLYDFILYTVALL